MIEDTFKRFRLQYEQYKLKTKRQGIWGKNQIKKKICVQTYSYGEKMGYGQQTCHLECGIEIDLHLGYLIQQCMVVRNLAFGNGHGISRCCRYLPDLVSIRNHQPAPRP